MSQEALQSTLNYNPKFDYKKDIKSTVMSRPEVQVSKALQVLKDNMPSKALDKASAAMKEIDSVIHVIESRLADDSSNGISFEEYKDALTTGDYGVQNKYEEGHRNSITGMLEAELYGTLFNMRKDVEDSLFHMVKEMYGNSIPIDTGLDVLVSKALYRDEEMYRSLLIAEQSPEGNVNYTATCLDSSICNALSSYYDYSSQFAGQSMTLVSNATLGSPNTIAANEEAKALLEESFQSALSLNLSDVDKLRQLDRGSMRKQTQESAFRKRDAMILADKAGESIANMEMSPAVDMMVDQQFKTMESATSALLDMNKMNNLERIYRTDLINTIGSKQSLRQLYSQI